MIDTFLIYEDWNHFIPTGKSWYKGLVQNQKKVYQLNHNHLLTNLDEKMDVVVYFDLPTNHIDINILRKFKNENRDTTIVGIVGDKFKPIFNEYKECIDVWVSMMYSFKSLEKTFDQNGIKLHFIPLAADHEIFFPTNSEKFYDVSFVGQFGNTGHGYRHEDKYLYPILDIEEIKAFTAGFKYRNCDNNHYVNHGALNDIYNKTKVNLNFHYDHQKTDDRIDFNGRTYEIAMSGNVQLCDHPKCREIFDNHIPYSTMDEWMTYFKVAYNDYKFGNTRSTLVRDYFVEKHSWKTRMKTFIDLLENL